MDSVSRRGFISFDLKDFQRADRFVGTVPRSWNSRPFSLSQKIQKSAFAVFLCERAAFTPSLSA